MATSKASSSSADTPITKRLHVSGLTPNITVADISKRLSTFGTVTALDKFGENDAVGQMKKFGYVTIETTQGNLSRCMNLLSGTTWKGAKLRIGEAKPDWRERLEKERAADTEPRKKKAKRYGGFQATDMSLVTPTNASSRPGWTVTPLGRVLHPVRMRPSHPLPPTKEALEKRRLEEEAAKKGKVTGKKRKRVRDPDTRARRRTIDVTKWGSTHLKGVFLDAVVAEGGISERIREDMTTQPEDVVMESDEDEDDSDREEDLVEEDRETSNDEEEQEAPASSPGTSSPPPRAPSASSPAQPATQPPALAAVSSTLADGDDADVNAEKTRSLNLLSSLFGNDDEWDGRESVGSDVDEEALMRSQKDRPQAQNGGDDDDFEVVPKAGFKGVEVAADGGDAEDDGGEEVEQDEDAEMAEVEPSPEKIVPSTEPAPAKAAQPPTKQTTNLKDLFAPREEEAGFSLIGHLDLDLELDDDVPYAIEDTTATTHQNATAETHTTLPSIPVTSSTRKIVTSHSSFFLDPKKPLFFPHPPSTSGQPITKARPKDIVEHFIELGWGWRNPVPVSGDDTNSQKEKERLFYRTGTEEEIRKRWEEKKVELTREWKRRHKEASKFSRRRRGGDTGDGEMV